MSARTIEHWYLEHPSGRRDIFLRTDRGEWRVETTIGSPSGLRKIWDAKDEAEAREIMAWLKVTGGRVEAWRPVPTGYNR